MGFLRICGKSETGQKITTTSITIKFVFAVSFADLPSSSQMKLALLYAFV
jgi:hypothetical protein